MHALVIMEKSKREAIINFLNDWNVQVSIPFKKPYSYSELIHDIAFKLQMPISLTKVCLIRGKLKSSLYTIIKKKDNLKWRHLYGLDENTSIYIVIMEWELAKILCECGLGIGDINQLSGKYKIQTLEDAIHQFTTLDCPTDKNVEFPLLFNKIKHDFYIKTSL